MKKGKEEKKKKENRRINTLKLGLKIKGEEKQ